MKYISIDLGGTNIRAAIMEDTNIIKKVSFKTDKNSFSKTLKPVIEFINSLKKEEIKGIGISAPGPTDYKKGIFKETPNLPGFIGKNIKLLLEQETGIKNIQMGNDANVMALANHDFYNNLGNTTQFFTISTGFGAGLIINDKIFVGDNEMAQEISCYPVAWKQEAGKILPMGSIEHFASGSGIEARSGKRAALVFNSKDNKDLAILNDAKEAIANLIAITSVLLNPSPYVFDGSLARNNKEFIKEAIELAKGRMFKGQHEHTKYLFSELGDDSGLIGAFILIKTTTENK